MAPSLHLIALRDLLSAEIGQEVIVGRPTEDGPDLCLWPWKVDLPATQRNVPPALQGNPQRTESPDLPMQVRFLVLPPGGSDVANLDLLDAVRKVFQAHPVIGVADNKGQVLVESIPTSELTAIFVAAGLPLRLCLAYRLESVG